MTTKTLGYNDIMTYLRKHGDTLQEMIDDKIKGGYAVRVKALRGDDKKLKNDSIAFFQHVIAIHQKSEQSNPKILKKWGREGADNRSKFEKMMDSKHVQDAVRPTDITEAINDFKGLANGIKNTARALMLSIVGPIQTGANLLSIMRKNVGFSNVAWNAASSAVIGYAVFYVGYEKIDVTPASAPAIETHSDDFCANPANLHGDALTAAFSRANFDPRSDKHSHYLSAMQGLVADIPPIVLMMVQSMETGFVDVEGSRSITLSNGTKLIIPADAQGPYQNQTVDFLERLNLYGKDMPIYQDFKHKQANGALSDFEQVTLHSLDKMLYRLKGTTGEQRRAIAADLKDGSLDIDEGNVMSLRYQPAFVGQLMALSFAHKYPELRMSRLPKDPEKQLIAIVNIMYNIYQDHLKGDVGADLYNHLSTIAGLKISDTKTAQTHMNKFGNSYKINSTSFVKLAEANMGVFKGYGPDMTFAQGLQSLHKYIDHKVEPVTKPLETFLSNHKGAKDAFEICAKDIQYAKLQEPLKATRLNIAMNLWGFKQ